MARSTFARQLSDRQIPRGAALYIIVGWVLVQAATELVSAQFLPGWVLRYVVVLVLIGFPVSLLLLWLSKSGPSPDHRSEPPASPPAPSLPETPPVPAANGGEDIAAIVAKVMAAEREERHRDREVLIAALSERRRRSDALAERRSAPLLQGAIGHDPSAGAKPAPPPLSPPPPTPRRSPVAVLAIVLILLLVAAGVWTILAPESSLAFFNVPEAWSGRIASMYGRIEAFAVALLEPMLEKMGIGVAAEHVFTGLLALVALVVIRDLIRGLSRPVARRAE